MLENSNWSGVAPDKGHLHGAVEIVRKIVA